jgi:hypothetical protein
MNPITSLGRERDRGGGGLRVCKTRGRLCEQQIAIRSDWNWRDWTHQASRPNTFLSSAAHLSWAACGVKLSAVQNAWRHTSTPPCVFKGVHSLTIIVTACTYKVLIRSEGKPDATWRADGMDKQRRTVLHPMGHTSRMVYWWKSTQSAIYVCKLVM